MKYSTAITILLGSFLSFIVQPMVGRTLLPFFGGSSTVWITCLAAFQILLLLGYGYAFIPSRARGTSPIALSVHLTLVCLAAIVAAFVPAFSHALSACVSSLPPVVGVLLAVLAVAGLPSIVLSANSTLVQGWTRGGREVYHLYAISNVGSLLGLLAYPLVVEPFIPLTLQWRLLGGMMLVYAMMLTVLKRQSVVYESNVDMSDVSTVKDNVPRGDAALWVVLPALSCALMTAATTYLTTDIVALPLVWAVLLSAFLISYIIGFSKIGSRLLPVWMALSIPVLAFAVWAMLPKTDNEFRFFTNVASVLALLIIVCSALHAWLFALRPQTTRLPSFYFALALGGCLGGLLAGIVPPLVFETTFEYPIVLVLSCGVIALWFNKLQMKDASLLKKVKAVAFGLLGLIVVVAAIDRGDHDALNGTRIYRARGFYGVVSVEKQTHSEYAPGQFCDIHCFYHGKTLHGVQLRDDSVKRKPTSYFSLNGGGIPFATLDHKSGGMRKPLRVAIVGMGMGSLAVYGKDGDYMRMYEISPEVINVATNPTLFSFISDCPAKVEIIRGDARLKLQKDAADGIEKFDLIFIDVYSGDSVPGHLVTKEAFKLFKSLLKQDGVIAFHISNWHIDLYSVMKAASQHLGMHLVETLSGRVINEYATETAWAFMTNDPYEPYMPNCCRIIDLDKVKNIPLMSDDCGSLIFNIHFGYYPEFID